MKMKIIMSVCVHICVCAMVGKMTNNWSQEEEE